MIYSARDLLLLSKVRKYKVQYALRIIIEARRVGIPASLGFALVEQESNFQNVFGHDPTIFPGAGEVTKSKYLAYKKRRGPHGEGGMQGVGPTQLTWWEYQDAADRLGGAWKPRYNIQVAFGRLATLIGHYGEHLGIERYNGAGPAAEAYATSVLGRKEKWHKRLT